MNAPRERPIIFSAPMVRAILEGRKSQTRRVVKDQAAVREGPVLWTGFMGWQDAAVVLSDPSLNTCRASRCPYGAPGDRLWVREAFIHEPAEYAWEASVSVPVLPASTVYRADFDVITLARGAGWSSPIHMPRKLSRITLEITGVRVERLQDISNEDSLAEGVNVHPDHHGKPRSSIYSPCQAYRDLWESINSPGSWDANPWVWVVSFRSITPNAK